MKKTLFLLTILVLCGSCQTNSESDVGKIIENLTYFKDPSTNLCFATINSSDRYGFKVVSITCVPCDSVKHLLR